MKLPKILRYIKAKQRIGSSCCFDTESNIVDCEFEGHNTVNSSKVFSSHVGRYTYISEDSHIYSTFIGRYTCIGPRCSILIGRHPITKIVSVHPVFFSKNGYDGYSYVKRDKFQEIKYAKDQYTVYIGNDVWIGGNVSILDGITIGDGAIIAAGAVVTKNVPPYTIVGGVPAKVLKHRFSIEEIDQLIKLSWWDKDENWIKSHSELFDDIKEFLKGISANE